MHKKYSKALTPADDYKCELPDDVRKQAEAELRETDSARNYALNELRDWIEFNPRMISVRMGNNTFSKI